MPSYTPELARGVVGIVTYEDVQLNGGSVAELWLVARPENDLKIEALGDLPTIVEPAPDLPRSGLPGEFQPLDEGPYEGPFGWLACEVDQEGFTQLLAVDGFGGASPEADWLLAGGVAPGQPFRVRIAACRTYRDYWGEYDVDYGQWEIVVLEHWPAEKVLAAWEAWWAGRDTSHYCLACEIGCDGSGACDPSHTGHGTGCRQ